MSDYGIFRIIREKLRQIHPSLKMMSQANLDEKPPYGILQKGIFEKKLPPFKTGYQKMTLTLVSRFKGEAEIQKLYQQTCAALEGLNLALEKGVSGGFVAQR